MTEKAEVPAPARLIEILSDALGYPDDGAISLISSTCNAILLVGRLDAQSWTKIIEDDDFRGLVETLALFEPRRELRVAAVELLEASAELEAKGQQTHPVKIEGTEARESSNLARYLWPIVSSLLPQAAQRPEQCDELFRLLKKLLLLLSNALPGQAEIHQLALQANKMLLEHSSTEACGFRPRGLISTDRDPLQDVSQADPYDPVASGLATVLQLCLLIDTLLLSSLAE